MPRVSFGDHRTEFAVKVCDGAVGNLRVSGFREISKLGAVWGVGFRVEGLGFRAWVFSGFRVRGSGFRHLFSVCWESLLCLGGGGGGQGVSQGTP